MASVQQQAVSSGGSDGGDAKLDERKRKRMISNRESARRCRMKKQQQVDELMKQVEQLRKQNKMIVEKTNEATDVFVAVASENNILRAQLSALLAQLHCGGGERIRYGTSMEPWQLPCPIITSANMFHC